jgi:hypothetical protein
MHFPTGTHERTCFFFLWCSIGLAPSSPTTKFPTVIIDTSLRLGDILPDKVDTRREPIQVRTGYLAQRHYSNPTTRSRINNGICIYSSCFAFAWTRNSLLAATSTISMGVMDLPWHKTKELGFFCAGSFTKRAARAEDSVPLAPMSPTWPKTLHGLPRLRENISWSRCQLTGSVLAWPPPSCISTSISIGVSGGMDLWSTYLYVYVRSPYGVLRSVLRTAYCVLRTASHFPLNSAETSFN